MVTGGPTPTAGCSRFGSAPFFGSAGGTPLNAPVIGIASTPDHGGYWLAATDGGVFGFGDAKFYGSVPGDLQPGQSLNAPVVGVASTPDGGGYWLVASDGGVFAFGDAHFHGVDGRNPPQQTGRGHRREHPGRLLARGERRGHLRLRRPRSRGHSAVPCSTPPITGMATTDDGQGYWMVAGDGGVFAFGDAPFWGSAG